MEKDIRDILDAIKNTDCPCRKKKCARHGDCDACRDYHVKVERKYPIACKREKKKINMKIESSCGLLCVECSFRGKIHYKA